MNTQPFMPTRAQWERAQAQLAAVTAERDAARAEVARLTAANNEYKTLVNDALVTCSDYSVYRKWKMRWDEQARAVLRGDTAPAGRE